MKKHILYITLICVSLITNASAQTGAKDINKVITHYLEVKDALAAGDGNVALSRAKDLLTVVKSVNTSSFNAAQRKTWLAYEPKLEFDSRHISEVNRVEHQREHFATLSANLYAVVKALPLNDTPLYESYCTMTKKTFLSKSQTGKDPYMGMDNCSKVTETLPAHQ
jgi:uncharacterized protein DUF3347